MMTVARKLHRNASTLKLGGLWSQLLWQLRTFTTSLPSRTMSGESQQFSSRPTLPLCRYLSRMVSWLNKHSSEKEELARMNFVEVDDPGRKLEISAIGNGCPNGKTKCSRFDRKLPNAQSVIWFSLHRYLEDWWFLLRDLSIHKVSNSSC